MQALISAIAPSACPDGWLAAALGGWTEEVADIPGTVLFRDSKKPAVARLAFGAEAWDGFVRMAAGR